MRRWYAVQSKPRQERVALANLLRQEYAAYLPHCTQRKLSRYQGLTAPLNGFEPARRASCNPCNLGKIWQQARGGKVQPAVREPRLSRCNDG